MVLFRALGWLLLGLSVAVAVRDGLFFWSEGAFHPLRLGELWLQLDFASLEALKSLTVRHLSPAVWARLAAPVLALPALPFFVVVGLLSLWFGQRRGERADSGFVLGSQRPRRRRRGGSLS